MAVTKRFTDLQSKLCTEKTNAYAIEAGQLAVKAIYSNQDPEMCLTLLNDTPQHIRKAFASWLRSFGVLVNPPAYGTAQYTIGRENVLVDQKQHKVFERLNNAPDVLAQEIAVRKEPKAKELKGTAQSRAQKVVESVIARLKKIDPEAATLLNDIWATKYEASINNQNNADLGQLKLAA